MADDKVALEIFIEADKAQMSLGDLEAGFDSMKERLKEVGRGSEEFKTLSTAMANTSLEIQNVEASFEALDSNAVAGEMGALAGGIGDVTASLVLMGGENETIEQIGASIETAMAISMGFKGAIEGVSAATKLYTDLQNKGKIATIAKSVAEKAAAAGTWLLNAANKALNITLKMNPIGLIVIAITAVVAAIVYFKDAIWGLIKTALEPFQFIIDLLIDGLQAMGIMASDEAIAQEEAAKKVIEASQKRREEIDRLIEAEDKKNEKIIAGLDFEIAKRKILGKETVSVERKKLFAILQASKVELDLSKQKAIAMANELQARIKLGDLTEEEKEKLLEESKEVLKVLEENKKSRINSARAFQLFETQVAKDELDRIDEQIDNQKKLNAEAKKAREAGAADRAMARSKEQQAKKDALMEDVERVEIVKTMQTEELDRHSIHIEGLISNEQALRDAMIQFSDAQLIKIEEERQARLAANQERLQSASQVIGAISSLNSAALATDLKNAGNNEKKKEQLRKASFEREKKLNIAMALVNGAQAQMSILAQTPKADFGIATAISMAAAAVTTIAQIAAIKATSYQGGGSPVASESASVSAGGAGAAGGGAAITPVSNTSTILGNQQVFVTETDITNTQNNVSVIEESATF